MILFENDGFSISFRSFINIESELTNNRTPDFPWQMQEISR